MNFSAIASARLPLPAGSGEEGQKDSGQKNGEGQARGESKAACQMRRRLRAILAIGLCTLFPLLRYDAHWQIADNIRAFWIFPAKNAPSGESVRFRSWLIARHETGKGNKVHSPIFKFPRTFPRRLAKEGVE